MRLVVWPTPGLEEVPARAASELVTARVLELSAGGLTIYEIARKLGRPRSMVDDVLQRCQQRAA